MAAGEVLIDGDAVKPGALARPGSEVVWERPAWCEPSVPRVREVLHRDTHLLAVNKPAGLPSVPGGGYLDHTLLAHVRSLDPRAVPVHRLGRWTSGVMLFALTPEARRALSAALREGTALKIYRALASGRPDRDHWEIDRPIGPVPHELLGRVHADHPGGAPARSEVQVVERRPDSFLADVRIRTGKPHQIRIHLAASGHPLVGDPLYPRGGVPGPASRALPGDPGYRLHAARLRIPHPDGSGPREFEAGIPEDLRAGGDPTRRAGLPDPG
jgi:23S rRNA pseudouridine1911/1915/1917 synthase